MAHWHCRRRREKVIEYYEYLYTRTTSMDEDTVLQDLPVTLKVELAVVLNRVRAGASEPAACMHSSATVPVPPDVLCVSRAGIHQEHDHLQVLRLAMHGHRRIVRLHRRNRGALRYGHAESCGE